MATKTRRTRRTFGTTQMTKNTGRLTMSGCDSAGKPSASSVSPVAEICDRSFSRRRLLQALIAVAPAPMATKLSALQSTNVDPAQPLDPAVLPRGIRSRFVENVNGIRMHVLEAGFEADRRPLVLMLHGFP